MSILSTGVCIVCAINANVASQQKQIINKIVKKCVCKIPQLADSNQKSYDNK